MEGSGLGWREAVSGGGERSQVELSNLRWRGAIAGGGEQSQLEGDAPASQIVKRFDLHSRHEDEL